MSRFEVKVGSVYAPGWHVYEEIAERHYRSRGCFDERVDAEEHLAYLRAVEECDSGLTYVRPPTEDGWAYGMAACGFVVRAPWAATVYQGSPELGDALDAHYAAAHPERWLEIKKHRAMSAD